MAADCTAQYVDTWEASIFVGSRAGYEGEGFGVNRVLAAIAAYQKIAPESVNGTVHVSEGWYVFKNYVEFGWKIGLINYPRFPNGEQNLRDFAIALGRHLLVELSQNRVGIVMPRETVLLTSPNAEEHPLPRGEL